MGKVELELLEWRTEGPDKPGVYNATVRPGFEQASLGEWHSFCSSTRVLILADGLWAG